MPPLIPDSVDCSKIPFSHPACPLTSSDLSGHDGSDQTSVGPPDAGEPGLVVNHGPEGTDHVAGVDVVDDTKTLLEEAKDSLPHPASPALHEQGEVTTMATTIMTQSRDEITTDITTVSDPMEDPDDHEPDTDWVMVGSMICIILVMAILAGE